MSRWWARLWRLSAARLPAAAALVVMVSLAAYSIGRARWVSGDDQYLAGLWLGLGCGLALAGSRFTGRAAAAYALALSLFAGALLIGRLWPAVWECLWLRDGESVWRLHLQTLTLLQRVGGWAAAMTERATITDTGLFSWLALMAGWNAVAWLAWWTGRRAPLIGGQAALLAAAPLTALTALSHSLADRPAGEFAVYLGAALVLVAHSAFRQEQASWIRRGVDYAEAVAVDWLVAGSLLVGVLSVAISLAPWVGTPEGWQTLADLTRPLRESAESVSTRLFSGVNPPPGDSESAASARTPDLGRIGQPLPQGAEIVMWVRLSDPPPPPEQAAQGAPTVRRHYWRSGLFATYDGAGWTPLVRDEASEATASRTLPPGRYALEQRFTIVAQHGDSLFAVNRPITASSGANVRVLAAEDAVLEGGVSDYSVMSWATDVSAASLRAAPAEYPPRVAGPYLQLPGTLPARVRQLALNLTQGAGTPYDKAVRISDYLRRAYPYRLDVPAPAPGRDAVDYFLFEAPGGYCSYYASAMAVLLRVTGVPARVVTGFAMGEYDYERQAYKVPASAAHAWVEVFFPGFGWVEFEPTAALPTLLYPESISFTPAALPTTPAPAAGRIGGGWVLAGVLAGLAGMWLAYAIHRLRPSPLPLAQRLYWQIRRDLARLGQPAGPSVTPGEFLDQRRSALAGLVEVRSVLEAITGLYEQDVYGPRRVSLVTADKIARRWQAAWRERWRLRWQRLRRAARRKGSEA